MRRARTTKCLTLSAMLVALGAVILIFGAYTDLLSLTVAAASSLIMVMVYIELGSPYTWLVWLATTLCVVIFAPGAPVWAQYLLVFGLYPIIKGYIEKIPLLLRIIAKLLIFNAAFFSLFLIEEFVLGISFFEFEAVWLRILVYATAFVGFFIYDYFIMYMARFYLYRFHERVARYLNR